MDYPECVHSDWTAAQDTDLVHYLDKLCQSLAVGASLLQPWDVCISEQDTISEELASLQGVLMNAEEYCVSTQVLSNFGNLYNLVLVHI